MGAGKFRCFCLQSMEINSERHPGSENSRQEHRAKEAATTVSFAFQARTIRSLCSAVTRA